MPSEYTPLVGGREAGFKGSRLPSPRDIYDQCMLPLIIGLLALKAVAYILFIVGDAYALAQ